MVRTAHGCLPFCLDNAWVPHKFVERPADIEYIREHLLPDGGRRGSPLNRIFVLHGLGGIGKTQLAAHFTYTHMNSFENVVWLDASSQLSLRKSLEAYGSRLMELRGRHVDSSQDSLATMATLAFEWLSGTQNKGGLLVLDGVGGQCGNHDALSGSYINPYLAGFHASILITTRLSQLSQLGHSRCIRSVDRDVSISILSQWCTVGNTVTTHLLELIDRLAGLPLALVIAGNFIQESGCSISSCSRMYNQDWTQVMAGDSPPILSLLGANLHDIGSAWRVSCRAIQTTDATAGKFLLLWACLGHGELWHELFRPESQAPDCPEWLLELREEWRFVQIVRSILRLSLTEKAGNMTYRMHPVLAKWIVCAQEWPQEDILDCQRIALHLTASAIPPMSSPDFAIKQRRLLPAANSRVDWLRQKDPCLKSQDLDFTTAVGTIGRLYADQGSLILAEWLYRRALENTDDFWSMVGVLEVQAAFVKVLARLRKDTEAKALCEVIRDRCEQVHRGVLCRQADHQGESIRRLSAEISGSLAALHTRHGRPNDAEKLFDDALVVQKELDGMFHCSTLDTMNDVGVLYTQEGFLDDAENQFRLVLNARNEKLGSSHPLYLQTLANLSLVKARQGQLQEAEELCSKAAEGTEAVLGWLHDTTLSIYRNLAYIYGLQGLFVDAAAIFRRVEGGCSEIFGEQHSTVLCARDQADSMLERAEIAQEADMAVSLVPTELETASAAALSSYGNENIKSEPLQ